MQSLVNPLRSLLLLLMLLFALVQWNDPDGLWWASVYGLVALILAVANWRPAWLQMRSGRVALVTICIALAVGVVLFWPRQAGFWRQDVWWEAETAREGMGMMIALLFSLTALPAAFGKRPSQVQSAAFDGRESVSTPRRL